MKKNKNAVMKKYDGVPDDEKAFRIILFDYMKINPKHIKMVMVGNKKIKIQSYNFCPYLEACKEFEAFVQKVCEMINPKVRFSRNYQNIRPHTYFCEEYFEIL